MLGLGIRFLRAISVTWRLAEGDTLRCETPDMYVHANVYVHVYVYVYV